MEGLTAASQPAKLALTPPARGRHASKPIRQSFPGSQYRRGRWWPSAGPAGDGSGGQATATLLAWEEEGGKGDWIN
jgi:hypothetical protein